MDSNTESTDGKKVMRKARRALDRIKKARERVKAAVFEEGFARGELVAFDKVMVALGEHSGPRSVEAVQGLFKSRVDRASADGFLLALDVLGVLPAVVTEAHGARTLPELVRLIRACKAVDKHTKSEDAAVARDTIRDMLTERKAGMLETVALLRTLNAPPKAESDRAVVAVGQPFSLKGPIELNVAEKTEARLNLISAIKLVRNRTGCDLKQAKDAVDAYRLTGCPIQ